MATITSKKRKNHGKKAERPIASWWWVRKDKAAPEVALYGDFKEGRGFKLILEDDKLYQESDFREIYGQAINPVILEIYEKIKDRDYSPGILTNEEMLVMRLYRCKNCAIEGCGYSHSWECFKNEMRNNFR